jgi:putative ABC transport system permease protein
MSPFSMFSEALDALRAYKGRSALTSLGIILGIAVVVALVTAGESARQRLEDGLQNIGKDMILIRPGGHSEMGYRGDAAPLTEEDADAIRKAAGTLLVGVAPEQVTERIASSRGGRWPTSVAGVVPELRPVRQWQLAAGRFINEEDIQTQALVCLIGQTVRRRLFPGGASPLGEWVEVPPLHVRVVGVLAEKGTSLTGADQDNQIFLPLSTFQHRLVGTTHLSFILTTARSPELLDPAEEAIRSALRRRHHLTPGAADDFDVTSVREMAELAEVLTGAMQILVAAVGSISLLVAGIGIMNMMLASVTQRTREVGLRRAVGATAGDILLQFETEAMLLTMAGGLLGVVLGLASGAGVARLAGWPLVISPGYVVLAVVAAGGTGLFFGYYPAWKASRLAPIQALRSE